MAKLKILLNFDFYLHCFAASLLASSSSEEEEEGISYSDRPGLAAALSEDYDPEALDTDSVWYSPQAYFASPSSSEVDIDEKAEIFIANFRRQLQIERQISLDIRSRQKRTKFYKGKKKSEEEEDYDADEDDETW
ncbi:hypothetical protein LINPERPRIM_LOCUS2787 [Linum perenne]